MEAFSCGTSTTESASRPAPEGARFSSPDLSHPRNFVRALPLRGPGVRRRYYLLGGVKVGFTEREAPDWDVLKRVAVLFALGCCACSCAAVLGCGAARAAAEGSISASGFGLRVAASLRRLGWPDDAVVFALAPLPVIELRGAIPLGNMVPAPFIILYLKKLATFLSRRSASATDLWTSSLSGRDGRLLLLRNSNGLV
ncbi:uncharacterized protein LOC133913548 isoform X2 [Phragmites australis]|uniref:uncharacterized protein LOC133913548 isoform X2 n=1 Tax=Phragmites australis TaxID=29695 RepID=UPI002D773184|nr:uncharacterized protein LOC133913548 isoform X2 [Phragmites australis]